MSEKDGGPAFPSDIHPSNAEQVVTGMTLRDYFAASALPHSMASFCFGDTSEPKRYASIAKDVYKIADAMLKERAK